MGTVFFTKDYPSLTVGPGAFVQGGNGDLHFVNGFLTIEDDDPMRDEKLGWLELARSSLFHGSIENLGDNHEGVALEGAPGSVDCPVCHKTFESDKKLRGHLMSHRPK